MCVSTFNGAQLNMTFLFLLLATHIATDIDTAVGCWQTHRAFSWNTKHTHQWSAVMSFDCCPSLLSVLTLLGTTLYHLINNRWLGFVSVRVQELRGDVRVVLYLLMRPTVNDYFIPFLLCFFTLAHWRWMGYAPDSSEKVSVRNCFAMQFYGAPYNTLIFFRPHHIISLQFSFDSSITHWSSWSMVIGQERQCSCSYSGFCVQMGLRATVHIYVYTTFSRRTHPGNITFTFGS